MSFSRARTDEQIKERQREIINACERLFAEGGYDAVNFKAIAQMTSFTRPSIYNYYKTKDEILLDLLIREVESWLLDVKNNISQTKTYTKDRFVSIMVDSLADNTKLMNLFIILFTTLEHNSRVEKLAEFKKKIMGVFGVFEQALTTFFPDASDEDKLIFINSYNGLMMGLYPMTHLTEKQLEAMSLAGVEHISPDFKTLATKSVHLLLSNF